MRTVLRTTVTTALTAAAFAALAPAAANAGTGLCREAYYGDTFAFVCFDLREDATTVAPIVTIACTNCEIVPQSVDKTGFVPNPAYPAPGFDPATGSVRIYEGDLGWVYVDGTEIPVHIDDFCVGDPAFCA